MARAVAAVEAGRRNGVEVKKLQIHHLVLELGSIILSGSHNTWIGKYIIHLYHFFVACRFKDSSCSRRRSLCGLPVGEVHRQVGFYFVCLLFVVILCPTTTCAGLATGDTEVVGDTGTTTGGGNRTGCCAGERTFFCSPFQMAPF